MTGAQMPLPYRQVLNAVLRADFTSFLQKTFHTLVPGEPFVPGWHVDAIAYRLEQVRRGEIRRLIINMPPRSLKSMAASVAFPAFVLGHNPSTQLICVSYAREFAEKLSNDFRTVIRTEWYQSAFAGARIGLKDTQGELQLTARGTRLATSVGGRAHRSWRRHYRHRRPAQTGGRALGTDAAGSE